ncbi:GIY-YIG nuclease family protein [Streptomyces violaceorubidus]|uniref:GIY-YIG nuclease family protein n=1 Tax=Streptomyces violaceorubidus TaxID=284042 RepID=UPI0004BE4700|nr:GIY-YIG nuclease family protein [Streptomyces violaceorubidus]
MTTAARPSARTIGIIDRALGTIAWASQLGVAVLYLAITAQPAVWRPMLDNDPVPAISAWGFVIGMTLIWMSSLHQEQVWFYNRRVRRNHRKTWAVGHVSVLFFAALSASAHDERIGMWIILGMGTLISLMTWSAWMRTKELPAEDQAVIDAIHDRETQEAAAAFDVSEKEHRRNRLNAIVTSLGYQLTDTLTPSTVQDEQADNRWQIPVRKHAPLVYFIRNGNRIKIGTTTDLKRRIRTLALRAENVALLLDGGKPLERKHHHQFADLRIGNTEWFAYEGALVDFIADQNRLARKEEAK